MSALTKSALAALALGGAVLASATLADNGPGRGPGQGAMLMEMFDGIDTDKDGKVSPAELAAHREAMFTASDANSDGVLSKDELAAHQTAMMAERIARRTSQMLERKDVNGDGSLSIEEMGKGPVESRFSRLDGDGDGLISKEEAQAAGQRFGEMRKKRHHGMMGDGSN